ncbi:MAG: hypothetical protein OES84_04775 [Kiritimatiellaceae bacterium]|nr:hypothetical protein [Kiritimatiellaceae bacterium]
MKLSVYCLLTVILLGHAVHASGASRVFTGAQGRSIEAELEKFNESRNEVSIKRAGQKRSVTVPISIFSQKDQDFIREWGRGQSILDKRLKADISRVNKRDADNCYGTLASTEVYTDHHFKIEFENRTTSDLEDLDLEYVVYYEQEHHIRNGRDVENKLGTLCKTEKISLPARQTTEFETGKVKLYTWVTASLKPVDAKMKGIRIRLTLTLSTGEKISREFVYPSSLDDGWVTKSVNAQRRVRN